MSKKFIVRKGVFLKTNNSTDKIIDKLIISLLPLIIVKTIYYPLTIINLIVAVITYYLGEYLVYYIIKKKKNIKELTLENFTLYSALIIYTFMPPSTSIVLLIAVTLLSAITKVLLGGFAKYKNSPYLVSILIMLLISNIYGISTLNIESATISNYLILLNIIGLGSLLYLVYNNTVKYRVIFSYLGILVILLGVGSLMGGYPLSNMLEAGILLGGIYLVGDSITTPVTNKGQLCYGMLVAVIGFALSFILPATFGVVSVIIGEFFTRRIDSYFMVRE